MNGTVPDFMEAIVGHRVWFVTEDGLLFSWHVNSLWPPKHTMKATCRSVEPDQTHYSEDFEYLPAPTVGCACGIYASRDPLYWTREALKPRYSGFEWRSFAWGETWLWGRLIEHANGYRAEMAYPKTVHVYDAATGDQIKERYGVAVVVEPLPTPPKPEPVEDGRPVVGWLSSFSGFVSRFYELAPDPPSRFDPRGDSVLWTPPETNPVKLIMLPSGLARLSDTECERIFHAVADPEGQR